MPFGTIAEWRHDRGYGFIRRDDELQNHQEFAHASQMAPGSPRPFVGMAVEYQIGKGRDGRRCAVNIVPLPSATEAA